VRLQFRIGDSLSWPDGGRSGQFPRKRNEEYVLLENVKPKDTQGIKALERFLIRWSFLTGLEIRLSMRWLQRYVLEWSNCRGRYMRPPVAERVKEDLDDAGESYLRFLNLTRADDSTERKHAQQFLLDAVSICSGIQRLTVI